MTRHSHIFEQAIGVNKFTTSDNEVEIFTLRTQHSPPLLFNPT